MSSKQTWNVPFTYNVQNEEYFFVWDIMCARGTDVATRRKILVPSYSML